MLLKTGGCWRALAIGALGAVYLAAAPRPGWADASGAVLGRWLTEDKEAVIEMMACQPRGAAPGQAGLCGRIAGITLDHPDDPMPKDVWGRPQCGETIIETNPRDEDGRWPGTIMDPRNGRRYSVAIWIEPDGKLRVRGYVGLSLLGSTQSWTRYQGTLRSDCLMQRPAMPA